MLLDTAGRTHIDEPLMAEMAEIRDAAQPHEMLLVADALTGQDAVNLAKNFNERVGLTGIVLTRMDGDGRGGAALSMRAVTGKPIKLLGVGEKMDALEDFHPARLADRILGMGDIVSLVEKAAQTIDAAQAAKMAEKMRKGVFDLNDLSEQLAQIEKLGGMGGIMGMLPGVAKMKDQLASANLDDKFVKRQRAIISSMTPQERRNPDILKASRKKRIAAGAGVTVEHGQPAPEAAPADGRHDEDDGRRRRQARHDGQARADDGHRRRHADADAGADRGDAEADRRRRAGPASRRARPASRRRRRPAPSTFRRNSRASAAAGSSPASAAGSIRSGGRRSDSCPRNASGFCCAAGAKTISSLSRRSTPTPRRRVYRRRAHARRRVAAHGLLISATGFCAATDIGLSRKRARHLRRLGGALVPEGFPGREVAWTLMPATRGRGLGAGGGPARARFRLRNARLGRPPSASSISKTRPRSASPNSLARRVRARRPIPRSRIARSIAIRPAPIALST